YQYVCYPRMVKVRDDLYLLTYHRGQLGVHLYYTTSTDGVNWGTPTVLYNASAAANKITYTEGPKAGETDAYYAVNPDLCVLQNGEILCVYARRPNSGYTTYNSYSSIELIRGTVSGDTILWSQPTTVYRGINWEPEIIQRADGRIEIFWSQAAPYVDAYGFTSQKRSSGVGMIYSTDGGYTFTPTLEEMAANRYSGIRVLEDYIGDMKLLPLDDARDESKLANNETKVVPASAPAGYVPQTVHFYSGQMPGVAELVGGQMMIVAESQPLARNGMDLVAAFSDEDGEWTDVGFDEEGPTSLMTDLFKAAAPTLCRFPSGEVLLSYNTASKACTRLLHKDGRNIASAVETRPLADEGYSGFWSGTAIVDSHTALVGMTYNDPADTDPAKTTKNRLLRTAMVRLNHTVDAEKKKVIADSNPQEWAGVTDALFVGSATETQATYRFACDDEKLYILIERKDDTLGANDSTFCSIFAGADIISLSFKGEDILHLPGSASASCQTTEDGCVFEFALDRAALGLTGSSVRVCPGLSEDGTTDTIDGMTVGNTSTWIKVNLK
ncbi:MAG: exo-alpha-sialidase, partial [Clostridia bacterium]|nr:exo-alpha-sialidase [Clostridia bacterium]